MTEFVRDMAGSWLPASLHVLVARAIEILLLLVLGLVLTAVIRIVFHRIYALVHKVDERLESMTPDDARRINTLLGVVQTLVILGLWSLLAVMMLSHAGVNIGPVLAGAGILGVALGFGAQHVVRDLITGFFIILENHVRLGDIAVINGTRGKVERITYRVMVLRDLEGTLHVFPHGQINTLANMTMDYAYAVVDIGVGYKEDPDRVMAVLRLEAERMATEPQWAAAGVTGGEVLGVEALGDSAVAIKVRIRTAPNQQWAVKREYLKRIKLVFDREGIEIPYPQQALHLGTQQGPLPVRLEWPKESETPALTGVIPRDRNRG